MMSPMNTNSLQTVVLSDDTQIATYCQVGLAIVTIIGNLINFFVIRKFFAKIMVYQIQQIDSIVTSVCQLGYIGILFSSISNAPNAYICTPASFLCHISLFNLPLNNLFLVTGRRMKAKAAFKGEPIPSDKSIWKKFVIFSACLTLYLLFVNLFNSTINVPFIPQYHICMRFNIEEAHLENWHNYGKLLIMIPFTLIICTNIYFDFDDIPKPPHLLSMNNSQNSPPIFDESPLNTSIFSVTYFAILVSAVMFSGSTDAGFKNAFWIHYYVIDLIKGPLIAMWTHHRLKQKSLKKEQQKMDVVELTLSAQAENSQLENVVLNDIQNMNVL